jgi:hypothetical protein
MVSGYFNGSHYHVFPNIVNKKVEAFSDCHFLGGVSPELQSGRSAGWS